MHAKDFNYDGYNLSDMGYILCDFNNGGDLETIANGSQITFNTTAVRLGSKHELLSTEYTECLTSTFQICKNPCIYEDMEISPREFRHLMRWLNRKSYHKFKFLEQDYIVLYFEASFNISKIELNGTLYGLELNMFTNRPYALQDPQKIAIVNETSNEIKTVAVISDEEGYVYPSIKIEIKGDGDLIIQNLTNNEVISITNCVSGEIITMNYPIIETSVESHKIQNDFNWNFLRLANTFETGKNQLTISLPCNIYLEYLPSVKMAI